MAAGGRCFWEKQGKQVCNWPWRFSVPGYQLEYWKIFPKGHRWYSEHILKRSVDSKYPYLVPCFSRIASSFSQFKMMHVANPLSNSLWVKRK